MYKKQSFLILLVISYLFLPSVVFSEDFEIRSLKTYREGNEVSFPVLLFNEESNDKLTIEFDINSTYEPGLVIVFKFCDKNWIPYNNIFLLNIGENIAYNLTYKILPSTINDAKYHFKSSFPDARGDVSFPFSGKWQFYITESYDTSIVYASGKFIVVHDPIPLQASIKREVLEKQLYNIADLARVFNLTVDFNLPSDLYPFHVQHVEIYENLKLEFPYIVNRESNDDFHAYFWDGNGKFTFTSKEIKPGKEYRQTDLRNTNIFSRKDVNAQFDGIETSRFFQDADNDLNGGSILFPYYDEYANYLDVKFRVRPPSEFNRSIYLVGSFNDWQVLPEYEMVNNDGLFTSVVNLKRGIYDYQYVAADKDGNTISGIDWIALEGNNWYTTNDYYIFLYYSEPEKGGYDKIIGFQQISSKK